MDSWPHRTTDGQRLSYAQLPYRDKDTLKTEYVDKGNDPHELAERWDVSARTIKKWIRRHGIETQSDPGRDSKLTKMLRDEDE